MPPEVVRRGLPGLPPGDDVPTQHADALPLGVVLAPVYLREACQPLLPGLLIGISLDQIPSGGRYRPESHGVAVDVTRPGLLRLQIPVADRPPLGYVLGQQVPEEDSQCHG